MHTRLLISILIFASCQPAIDSGEELARTHCSGCHLFPEPNLLDKATWVTSTLPDMGQRLGLYTQNPRDSVIAPLLQNGLDPDPIFPEQPVISKAEWQAIFDYYEDNAPGRSESSAGGGTTIGLPGFVIQPPALSFSPPLTTLVQIQESYNAFFVGNYAAKSSLVLLHEQGNLMYRFDLPGAPVTTRIDRERLFILSMGRGPEPTVTSAGAIYVVDDPNEGPKELLSDLKRPVDLKLGDLNGNGLIDLLVCEYGHYTGKLSWYENKGEDSYTRHVLSEQPGAIAAEIYDADFDGDLDIMTLMAQGDEGFDLYLNQGDGTFEGRRLLRFPPVYGSTSFSLIDFDGDGRQDILYTNGDNADSSPVLKNYHGIRIFRSTGLNTFEETFFFPLHGAFSARAADFDRDGDLDIATIAYFPDYAGAPEESFILLKNDGELSFTPFSFEGAQRGRWLVMDVGDIDGDEDPDILLGSNIGFGPNGDETGLYEKWERESVSYVVLENNLRSPGSGVRSPEPDS